MHARRAVKDRRAPTGYGSVEQSAATTLPILPDWHRQCLHGLSGRRGGVSARARKAARPATRLTTTNPQMRRVTRHP